MATCYKFHISNQCKGNEGIQCSLKLHELCLASLLSGTQTWRSLFACGQCSSELKAVAKAIGFLLAFSFCLNSLQVITSQQISALTGESGELHFCQTITAFLLKNLLKRSALRLWSIIKFPLITRACFSKLAVALRPSEEGCFLSSGDFSVTFWN